MLTLDIFPILIFIFTIWFNGICTSDSNLFQLECQNGIDNEDCENVKYSKGNAAGENTESGKNKNIDATYDETNHDTKEYSSSLSSKDENWHKFDDVDAADDDSQNDDVDDDDLDNDHIDDSDVDDDEAEYTNDEDYYTSFDQLCSKVSRNEPDISKIIITLSKPKSSSENSIKKRINRTTEYTFGEYTYLTPVHIVDAKWNHTYRNMDAVMEICYPAHSENRTLKSCPLCAVKIIVGQESLEGDVVIISGSLNEPVELKNQFCVRVEAMNTLSISVSAEFYAEEKFV